MSIEHFKKVICVTSSRNCFIVGDIYARIGDNNGIHVFYIDKNGDPIDVLCHNYDDGLYLLDPETGDVDFKTKFEEIEPNFRN